MMDYATLRTSQLQHLASGGDVAAAKEISRRTTQASPAAALDITQLDDPALRRMVPPASSPQPSDRSATDTPP